jgi:hypothetical protein
MAGHIIADAGYENVVLTHPLGGPDHGADATCTKDGVPCVMAAYFPLGPKTLPTVKNKLIADLKAAKDGDRDFKRMAFVVNQKLTEGQRKKLIQLGGDDVEVEVFDLERCTHILDLPHMAETKERYLDIPAGKPPLLVAVDVIGVAGYLEDDDGQLFDRLVDAERSRLQQDAQELRKKPTDPIHYKTTLVPLMQTFGYQNLPAEPPKAMTDEEIEQHVERFESNLKSHWQESLDYLAGISFPAVHFRIANGARSFLNNVQVIITFEDVEGVEFNHPELFRIEKLEDPDWREPPGPFGIDTNMDYKLAPPANYPINWRNVDGNLRVRITLPELRPTPPWESEEECGDDFVLVVREIDLESVTVTFTATADTYGEAFEGTLTVPIERISAIEAARSAVAVARNQR